jgi:hypothetical protein
MSFRNRFTKNCKYNHILKTISALIECMAIVSMLSYPCLANDEIQKAKTSKELTSGSFSANTKYIVGKEARCYPIELEANAAHTSQRVANVEKVSEYDPFGLADFFDIAEQPVDDGLLVGYDQCGVPLMLTEQDLEDLTHDELIDKIRRDPQFHSFREGYSLLRVKTVFPDFKLPVEVLIRNRLPMPGQFVTALQVIDEKKRPVYKRNGEKALYFLRPLSQGEISSIHEQERQEAEWDKEEEDLNENLIEDQDETEIYDGELKARFASEIFTPEKERSLVQIPEWTSEALIKQGYFGSDIQSRLSYTQFWVLVGEGRIERVKFTRDRQVKLLLSKGISGVTYKAV